MKHYYDISRSTKALVRAKEEGFGELLEDIEKFGSVKKISTDQYTNRKYREIKIIFE